MALPLVIPNTVQVRLLFSIQGNGAVNVLHAIVPSGFLVTQAATNTLGSAIKTAWATHLGAHSSAGNGLIRVGMRDLRQANQAEFLDTGAAVVGSGTGDTLPAGTALCITLRTALSGKSFRGRVYLGGFIETANGSSGTVDAAAVTAAVAFMGAVDTAMDGQGMTLAVASRPAERYTIVKTTFHSDGTSTAETIGQGNARPGTSQAVTAVSSRNNLWESQRRRQNGRGVAPAMQVEGRTVQTAAGREVG